MLRADVTARLNDALRTESTELEGANVATEAEVRPILDQAMAELGPDEARLAFAEAGLSEMYGFLVETDRPPRGLAGLDRSNVTAQRERGTTLLNDVDGIARRPGNPHGTLVAGIVSEARSGRMNQAFALYYSREGLNLPDADRAVIASMLVNQTLLRADMLDRSSLPPASRIDAMMALASNLPVGNDARTALLRRAAAATRELLSAPNAPSSAGGATTGAIAGGTAGSHFNLSSESQLILGRVILTLTRELPHDEVYPLVLGNPNATPPLRGMYDLAVALSPTSPEPRTFDINARERLASACALRAELAEFVADTLPRSDLGRRISTRERSQFTATLRSETTAQFRRAYTLLDVPLVNMVQTTVGVIATSDDSGVRALGLRASYARRAGMTREYSELSARTQQQLGANLRIGMGERPFTDFLAGGANFPRVDTTAWSDPASPAQLRSAEHELLRRAGITLSEPPTAQELRAASAHFSALAGEHSDFAERTLYAMARRYTALAGLAEAGVTPLTAPPGPDAMRRYGELRAAGLRAAGANDGTVAATLGREMTAIVAEFYAHHGDIGDMRSYSPSDPEASIVAWDMDLRALVDCEAFAGIIGAGFEGAGFTVAHETRQPPAGSSSVGHEIALIQGSDGAPLAAISNLDYFHAPAPALTPSGAPTGPAEQRAAFLDQVFSSVGLGPGRHR